MKVYLHVFVRYLVRPPWRCVPASASFPHSGTAFATQGVVELLRPHFDHLRKAYIAAGSPPQLFLTCVFAMTMRYESMSKYKVGERRGAWGAPTVSLRVDVLVISLGLSSATEEQQVLSHTGHVNVNELRFGFSNTPCLCYKILCYKSLDV